MPKPTKRSVLEVFKKDRLVDIADGFELGVAQSRARSEFVDALAASKRASFEDILKALTRDELKQVCSAHDIDDRGRDKQSIVDRILGHEAGHARDAGPAYVATPAAQRKRKSRPAIAAIQDLPYDGDGSTKARLRRFSLAAAGGYRGPTASVDFAQDLIACFGWNADDHVSAETPYEARVIEHAKHTSRKLTAYWPERRTVIEIAERDADLVTHWKSLLPVCLQLDPSPQYVVLSNQRDVHLFDLARDKASPRLAASIDQLPKHSEAFPFLTRDWTPGTTPRIVDDDRVSKEVANLVAKVHKSFQAAYPKREPDVIRFTLQCIIAMFAEDVGLLPRQHFTNLLYEGAANRDAEQRIRELFTEMSRPGEGDRTIRYFNGGLFAKPVSLPVSDTQLRALTRAAEANWTHVDPHIFGSVFTGIMGDAERHATGGHYTARDDIMRVVGPTIVEPWRKRIRDAKNLGELRELRAELGRFRVLDPACGSGNFLYVAYRELCGLETELLVRMHDFRSVQKDTEGHFTWGIGISTTNFFGIDINEFAVELAKVTLNIAKKLAFEERKLAVADVFGQYEMEVDRSLPLDNLNNNIVRADALFTEWPRVEAIVGNPPFLGGTKVREELGDTYVARLREAFPEVHGKSDLCALWFRRAHDRLRDAGRAGLVATQSIRVAKTREASLDYIAAHGGTITNAVSSRPWPGTAVVTVSMVNWVKGHPPGPYRLEVDGVAYERLLIPTHLQLHADVGEARPLTVNENGTIQGVQFGVDGFQIPRSELQAITIDPCARKYIRPVATGSDLLRGTADKDPTYVVDLRGCDSQGAAKASGAAYRHVKAHVLPFVEHKARTASTAHYRKWLETWWRPRTPRADFFSRLTGKHRIIVCSRPAARAIFVFISMDFIPTDTLQVFGLDDDYSFGILQSSLHWKWAEAKGSKLKGDIRYLNPVWNTFPWPQGASAETVAVVAAGGRGVRETRDRLMQENGWSLRQLHQAADVAGSHPLKDAQAALDEAVAAAYDIPPGQDVMGFLLELNLCLAEDEAQGRPVLGPGLPAGLDPKDARWFSTDCIEPPPLGS